MGQPHRHAGRSAIRRILTVLAAAVTLLGVGLATPALATPGPDPYRASQQCDDGESPGGTTDYRRDSDCYNLVVRLRADAQSGLGGSYGRCEVTFADEPAGPTDTVTMTCSGLRGGYDCGDAGFLTERDAAVLRDRGLAGDDPCAVAAAVDVGQSLVAGPFGFLTTGAGSTGGATTWDVLEDTVVRSGGVESRQARCLLLRSVFPIVSGGQQYGKVTVTQRICKGFDPDQQAFVLTNGTFNRAAGGWQPPQNPVVSVESTFPLIGFVNGGPGGSGFTSAVLVPTGGTPNGGWEVQLQSILHVGVGIPASQGTFLGFQRSLQQSFRINKGDLPNPS